MKTVYLAGPIHGVKDPHTWRRYVIDKLPDGWAALNPLDIERFVHGDDAAALVQTDLNYICKCDALLALVDTPSWGTAMEIRFAKTWGIPVIGWKPSGNVDRVSPWLEYHCTLITPTLAEAINFLFHTRSRLNAQG
jgi:nucleoside 2-deoxyribosyltransferase